MPNTKVTIFALTATAAGVLAGCQQEESSAHKKTGSYTAARHTTVGSNIPQRESVDATGASYDPDQFSNQQQQMSNLNRGLSGSGR